MSCWTAITVLAGAAFTAVHVACAAEPPGAKLPGPATGAPAIEPDSESGLRLQMDKTGRATAFVCGAETIRAATDVRIASPGWKHMPGLAELKDLAVTDIPGGRRWSGTLEIETGKACRVEQEVERAGQEWRVRIAVSADETIAIEGAFFWLDLPVAVYAGGYCDLGRKASAEFPMAFSEAGMRFLGGSANRVTFSGPEADKGFALDFDRDVLVRVQDARGWKSDVYNVFAEVVGGALPKGKTARLAVTIRRFRPEFEPVNLTVTPARVLGQMDGFGGNYCFEIESPVSQYTLKNLNVAWARTEMTPAEWEPRNDNDDPGKTDWEFLKAQDKEGTNLRREFLLAQQIQRKGVPYSITIWRLPEWCYAEPAQGFRMTGGAIKQGVWPEILECIGSYLVYAKKTYGVEPDFFSFNEPNGACYVKFTPEEHRDAIRRIGVHFKELGLKTRMLLGDVSYPGAYDFILPAAGDTETMRYVGALSFHSWNGADPAVYEKWASTATRLGIPLLVGELGVDPSAWEGRKYRSFEYGLREVRMYQELIRYARPRGTMQWEFTADYGIADEVKDPATGATNVVPHARFWFVKHFCNLTPRNADVLETASDLVDVRITAFRGRGAAEREYALHIANLSAPRTAVVTGLPAGAGKLRAVRTSQTESFRELPPVEVEAGGSIRVTLPARSLLTLTTLRETR
ncbi:MAG: hypothetical protein FJ225_13145 [Lentisphaerae bacterium]|nr:hypothetical protein [Lentisphaerota bacterium]